MAPGNRTCSCPGQHCGHQHQHQHADPGHVCVTQGWKDEGMDSEIDPVVLVGSWAQRDEVTHRAETKRLGPQTPGRLSPEPRA